MLKTTHNAFPESAANQRIYSVWVIKHWWVTIKEGCKESSRHESDKSPTFSYGWQIGTMHAWKLAKHSTSNKAEKDPTQKPTQQSIIDNGYYLQFSCLLWAWQIKTWLSNVEKTSVRIKRKTSMKDMDYETQYRKQSSLEWDKLQTHTIGSSKRRSMQRQDSETD